jgi:hypothetical protein
MAGFRIEGNTSGNVAEVDANNNLKVVTPTTVAQAGYTALASVITDGSTAGGTNLARSARRIESSDSFRLRVGIDSPLFFENFTGAALNSALWNQSATTFVPITGSGFLQLNSTSLTTTGAATLINSWRAIPVLQDGAVRIDYSMQFSAAMNANITFEGGLGIGNTSTTAPTDGAFFRVTGAGDWIAVLTNNSVEITSDIGVITNVSPPSANTRYECAVILDVNQAYYYINNVLVAYIVAGATTSGAVASGEQRIFFRENNTGVPTTAVNIKISSVSATLLDLGGNRPYRDALCGAGFNAIQGQTGATMGSTANYANSTGPVSATLANATAGYTTLGGQWQFAAVAGAVTDYAIFAFQVPAGTVSLPGKTLYITGVRIDSVNTGAAVATTATILQWGLAVGSSAVSLATAETLGTSKAPRRYALGMQGFVVGAAIGAQGPTIDTQFQSPLVVNEGEYFHVIVNCPVGTATASEIFRGTVMVNGYFE